MVTVGHVKSFDLAAELIGLNAELEISGRHLNRLAAMIGTELAADRDRRTEDYVHHRRQPPTGEIPKKVAVGLDGGRVNTREAGHGPGVHESGWREDKIGLLQVLDGPSFDADPHPEPPACFRDAEHVRQMVRGFVAQKGIRRYDEPELDGDADQPEKPPLPPGTEAAGPVGKVADGPPAATGDEASEPATAAPAWPPKRVDRTCVASMARSRAFGPILAAEAYARNFFAAEERSFLGDGLKYNWQIQQAWFPDFTPILDFIHPLSYLYLTAQAVSPTAEASWARYLGWMTACWQGRASAVIAEVREEQRGLHERLGEPAGKLPTGDPREVVRRTLNYLENNVTRMNYPDYRRRGLVVTTAAVESLVKEFNYRVKGTEKFWNDPGGTEAILQIRAAVLSKGDRLATYLAARPGCSQRRRPTPQAREAQVAA
jgi:hypothetical protein